MDEVTPGKRLKEVRTLMGHSQRQMAKEFGVAPGTISLWEKGERQMPGPALKLLEIFESNLGVTPPQTGLEKIGSSWSYRTIRSGMKAGALAAKLTGLSLRSLVASNEKADQLKKATQVALAKDVLTSVGALKGLLMKVAQMASYMDFALEPEAREILSELQHASQPMAPDVISRVVEKELGDEPGRIFKSWSKYPFAAASIGQVHRATLRDGTEVAVKVQYPQIVEALKADLANTALIDSIGAMLFRAQERGVVMEELRERFLEECDYTREAENMQEFSRMFEGRPAIRIPEVFPDYSTGRVLTMEYCEGKRFAEFLATATADEKNFAGEQIYDFAFEGIFKHGVFNCDPHPGNYLFTDDSVVFLDFGCVKHYPRKHMDGWVKVAKTVLEQRRKGFRRMVTRMGFVPDPDRIDFEEAFEIMLVLYEPWLRDEPFAFNRHYVEKTWRAMITDNPAKFEINMPRDSIFTNRLQWGLYAVLADLGASSNWRRRHMPLLYGDDPADYPPPILPRRADELASKRAQRGDV